jgi:hypothetical protein
MTLGDLAGVMGGGDLEDRLCEVDGERRMLHVRTPPLRVASWPELTLAHRCR